MASGLPASDRDGGTSGSSHNRSKYGSTGDGLPHGSPTSPATPTPPNGATAGAYGCPGTDGWSGDVSDLKRAVHPDKQSSNVPAR